MWVPLLGGSPSDGSRGSHGSWALAGIENKALGGSSLFSSAVKWSEPTGRGPEVVGWLGFKLRGKSVAEVGPEKVPTPDRWETGLGQTTIGVLQGDLVSGTMCGQRWGVGGSMEGHICYFSVLIA